MMNDIGILGNMKSIWSEHSSKVPLFVWTQTAIVLSSENAVLLIHAATC